MLQKKKHFVFVVLCCLISPFCNFIIFQKSCRHEIRVFEWMEIREYFAAGASLKCARFQYVQVKNVYMVNKKKSLCKCMAEMEQLWIPFDDSIYLNMPMYQTIHGKPDVFHASLHIYAEYSFEIYHITSHTAASFCSFFLSAFFIFNRTSHCVTQIVQ